MSGLGARAFQETPLQTFGLEGAGTDAIRVARQPFRLEEVESRPILEDLEIEPGDFVEEIVSAFEETYRVIRNHKAELLGKGKYVDRLADVPIRVLFRPTATYAGLIEESSHPYASGDESERELIVGQIWAGVETQPLLQRIVLSEFDQLLAGDVPYFYCTPSTRIVHDVVGRTFECAFPETGLDSIRAESTEWESVISHYKSGLSRQVYLHSLEKDRLSFKVRVRYSIKQSA